jgi:hypothetical protein
MLELLKDSNVKLRRRAMATLGELLYYVHTLDLSDPHAPLYSGVNDNNNNNNNGQASESVRWYVPGSTVPTVARCLQEGEDEIVCHYASKTVENILAQASPIQCRRFASLEIGVRLADLALRNQRRSDALHSTAAAALSHFLRRVLLPDNDSSSSSFPQQAPLTSEAPSPGYGNLNNNNNNLFSPDRAEVMPNIEALTISDHRPSTGGEEMPNSLSPIPNNLKHFQAGNGGGTTTQQQQQPASSATVAAGQPGAGGAPGPRLVARIFERNGGGASAISEGVMEPSSAKVQIAYVTMVLALFWESGDGDQDCNALLSGGIWPLESPRSPHSLNRGIVIYI